MKRRQRHWRLLKMIQPNRLSSYQPKGISPSRSRIMISFYFLTPVDKLILDILYGIAI